VLALTATGNCPLLVEGRVEFLQSQRKAPVATVPVPLRSVLIEPIQSQILHLRLPDAAALPDGEYLLRVILDIGLDHYIGAQKRLTITRENHAASSVPSTTR